MSRDITQIIEGLDRSAEIWVNDAAKSATDAIRQKLQEFSESILGNKRSTSDPLQKNHTLLTHGQQVVLASVDKLKSTKEATKQLIPWTDVQCQAAISMIKDIIYTVQQVIQLPNKLLAAAARIVNNVTDSAISMVNQATSFLDQVGKGIDNIINASGAGGALKAVQDLLDSVNQCPLLSNSDIGKNIKAIRDKLSGTAGQAVQEEVNKLKQQLVSPVNDAIRDLAKTPLGKLAEMSKMYNDALSRGGVTDALNKVSSAVQCLNILCKSVDVINAVYSTDFENSISNIWDSATGSIKTFGVSFISSQVNAGISGLQGLQRAVNSGIGGAGRAVADITRGIDAARTHASESF